MLKRVWYYWYNIILGILAWQVMLSLIFLMPIPTFGWMLLISVPYTISMIGTGALIPSIWLAYREKVNARNS